MRYINIGFFRRFKQCFLLTGLLLFCQISVAQESVFELFNSSLQQADDYYVTANYESALKLYETIAKQKTAPKNINLRLARSYYFTHAYQKAKLSYDAHLIKNELSEPDQFYYAETLASIGEYKEAAEMYRKCYEEDKQNDLLAFRIWRMENIDYLYEDSLDNAVRYISLNTTQSELSATPYQQGIIYTSNQQPVAFVQKSDAKTNAPFYQLYQVLTSRDPFDVNALIYKDSAPFAQSLAGNYNLGPTSFYNAYDNMVLAKSSETENSEGIYPLQLYFAAKKDTKWLMQKAFEFNDNSYSLSEPWISEDGSLLFYSANNPGGYGGTDIYFSQWNGSNWSVPQNAGVAINTPMDERFPFKVGNSFYFSSNGHSGLGGFDIFMAEVKDSSFTNVENLGYPINSGYDDLAFSIDSLNRHGFLSSNRANGGLDDDLYEFDLGLQSYPLVVSGKLKFIEHNWMDSTALEPLPDVKMVLIDNNGDKTILETKSDNLGGFNFVVPYYSQYKIRIIGADLDGVVSFEVPKYTATNQSYEIVVVNDDFKKLK